MSIEKAPLFDDSDLNARMVQAEAFAQAVEASLEEDLSRERRHVPRVLGDAAHHLVFAGKAKRARPRLVWLFGEAVGANMNDLVDVAVTSELMHSASLLHDDVVDEGSVRRGKPTANSRWGNSVAVLSGDLALTTAFGRLRRHAPILTHKAVDVVHEMTRGAMLEVEGRGRAELSLREWRDIAVAKTGALFGFCGYAAAMVSGDVERAERFDKAARHAGIAFQLADDLDDLLAGGDTDSFSDLIEMNPSYPVLCAVADSVEIRNHLIEAWSKDKVDAAQAARLGAQVLRSEGPKRTLAAIRAEVEVVKQALAPDALRPSIVEVLFWAEHLAMPRSRISG
jgi:geranylgeranyl pyrophosphate synthase